MYNTWPLMDGQLIPRGLAEHTSLLSNLFENHLTVQFNHRMIAYLALLWGGAHALLALRAAGFGRFGRAACLLAAGLLLQVVLGIWTLVAVVPLDLALAHQAGAFVVLGLAVYQLHVMRTAQEAR